ncbi:MAG: phosphotyrosine protein phosphatase [Sphingobacteriales bacterium]|nr:MAG: phosphotyrosine protein phosphatase [Sphingobacteriales bacterium]
MTQKKKILFVCTINRMRSATAHKVFEHDERFEVRSAGTDKNAATVLSNELLEWAEVIIVMEKVHRNFIRAKFPLVYNNKKIVCLYIPDEYDYMQPELIIVLKEKVEDVLRRGLL